MHEINLDTAQMLTHSSSYGDLMPRHRVQLMGRKLGGATQDAGTHCLYNSRSAGQMLNAVFTLCLSSYM